MPGLGHPGGLGAGDGEERWLRLPTCPNHPARPPGELGERKVTGGRRRLDRHPDSPWERGRAGVSRDSVGARGHRGG